MKGEKNTFRANVKEPPLRALTAPGPPWLSVAPRGVNSKTASVRDILKKTERDESQQYRYLAYPVSELVLTAAKSAPAQKAEWVPPPVSSPTTTAPSPLEDNVINLSSIRRVEFSERNRADLPLQAGWTHGGRRNVL